MVRKWEILHCIELIASAYRQEYTKIDWGGKGGGGAMQIREACNNKTLANITEPVLTWLNAYSTYNLLGREYHTKMAVKRDCWGQYGMISGKLWQIVGPLLSANSFLPEL